MGLQEAVTECLTNYVGLDGRAKQPEFWWWMLFLAASWIIVWACGGVLLGFASGAGAVAGGMLLALFFLPWLSVTVRRLHDTDRSGWWLALIFVPVLGWGLLVYFLLQPSTEGPNRFGDGLVLPKF